MSHRFSPCFLRRFVNHLKFLTKVKTQHLRCPQLFVPFLRINHRILQIYGGNTITHFRQFQELASRPAAVRQNIYFSLLFRMQKCIRSADVSGSRSEPPKNTKTLRLPTKSKNPKTCIHKNRRFCVNGFKTYSGFKQFFWGARPG